MKNITKIYLILAALCILGGVLVASIGMVPNSFYVYEIERSLNTDWTIEIIPESEYTIELAGQETIHLESDAMTLRPPRVPSPLDYNYQPYHYISKDFVQPTLWEVVEAGEGSIRIRSSKPLFITIAPTKEAITEAYIVAPVAFLTIASAIFLFVKVQFEDS
jgi:hypothetical protein